MEGKGREALIPLIFNEKKEYGKCTMSYNFKRHPSLTCSLGLHGAVHVSSALGLYMSALRESSVVVVVLIVWLGGVWGRTEVSNTVAWLNQWWIPSIQSTTIYWYRLYARHQARDGDCPGVK